MKKIFKDIVVAIWLFLLVAVMIAITIVFFSF